MTQSKELSNNVRRAHQKLADLGVEVSYTQVMSAMAAFHGFSNREEWLQSQKAPERQNEEKPKTFIERLLAMTPEELSHANWLIAVNGLKQAVAEIERLGGGHASWLSPYVNIAAESESEHRKLALATAMPFTVMTAPSLMHLKKGFWQPRESAQTLEAALERGRRHLKSCPEDVAIIVVTTVNERAEVSRLVRQLDGTLSTTSPALVGWEYVEAEFAKRLVTQVAVQASSWATQGLSESNLVDLGETLEAALLTGKASWNCQEVAKSSVVNIRPEFSHMSAGQLYEFLRTMVNREDAFVF